MTGEDIKALGFAFLVLAIIPAAVLKFFHYLEEKAPVVKWEFARQAYLAALIMFAVTMYLIWDDKSDIMAMIGFATGVTLGYLLHLLAIRIFAFSFFDVVHFNAGNGGWSYSVSAMCILVGLLHFFWGSDELLKIIR